MSTDPEVLDKIKRACSPQKAIYDMAEYMGGYDADIIGAVDTANKASQDASTALSTVNTVRVTADNALSTANQASATASNATTAASSAQTAAANAQTTADKAVSDAATALEAGNKGIADAANALAASNRVKTIADEALAGANASVNGLDVTSDQSTVSVTATKNTGSPDVNALPVASAASAGVMNSATFLAIEGLNSRVAALENEIRTYLVVLPNTTPTQAEITTAYRTGYPFAPNPPLDGTVVIDSEKDLFYQWVGGSSQWIKLSGQQIGMFTNSTLGTIKGSTTEGQVAAEADGTGSLNGYDALKSGIAANTTALGTLTTRVGAVETKNTQQDTSISTNATNITGLRTDLTTLEGKVNTNTTGLAAVKTNADRAVNSVSVLQNSTGVRLAIAKNDATLTEKVINPVTEADAGIVTPAMYAQWNAGGGGAGKVVFYNFFANQTAKTEVYTDDIIKTNYVEISTTSVIWFLEVQSGYKVYGKHMYNADVPFYWGDWSGRSGGTIGGVSIESNFQPDSKYVYNAGDHIITDANGNIKYHISFYLKGERTPPTEQYNSFNLYIVITKY